MTVRDLFAHRSGLSGNAGNDLEALGFTRDEIMRRLRYLKPASSFRSTYAYSNFGITQGALAAAKAAGLSWEDAAEARLYKRLGMASTSSRHSDFLARTNRASLHVRFNGAWTALATRDPDGQSPAGGVSSTVRDLAQWMRLELANGRLAGEPLIDEDAIGQTHAPLMDRGNHPMSGVPAFYGLGWNVEYPQLRHRLGPCRRVQPGRPHGGEPRSISRARHRRPDERVSDRRARRDRRQVSGEGHGRRHRRATGWASGMPLFASLFGPAIEAARKTYAHRPADASPALPLSAYAGTYANAYLGTVSRGRSRRRVDAQARPQWSAVVHADALRPRPLHLLSLCRDAGSGGRGDLRDRSREKGAAPDAATISTRAGRGSCRARETELRCPYRERRDDANTTITAEVAEARRAAENLLSGCLRALRTLR